MTAISAQFEFMSFLVNGKLLCLSKPKKTRNFQLLGIFPIG